MLIGIEAPKTLKDEQLIMLQKEKIQTRYNCYGKAGGGGRNTPCTPPLHQINQKLAWLGIDPALAVVVVVGAPSCECIQIKHAYIHGRLGSDSV